MRFTEDLIQASTVNGDAWLRKYLHPPGTKTASYNGYPDTSVTPCVHVEWRIQTTADKNTAAGKRIYLITPGLFAPMFYSYGLPSQTAEGVNQWRRVETNDQIEQVDILRNYSRGRLAYYSHTIQHDCTGFNDQGMVHVAQFNPGVQMYTAFTLLRSVMDRNMLGSVKKILKHMTKLFSRDDMLRLVDELKHHPKVAKLTGAGFDLGAFVRGFDDFEVLGAPKSASVDGYIFQVVELGRSIEQSTDVTMLSPTFYTERAVEGAFIVQKVNEPINGFVNMAAGRYRDGASTQKMLYCLYETADNGNNPIMEFFTTEDGSDLSYDVPWGPWSWSYVYFDGIQTERTELQQAPVQQFKMVQGWEFNPMPRTITNSLTCMSAGYDPKALTTAAILVQSVMDASAAKYNTGGLELALMNAALPSLMGSAHAAISDQPHPEPKNESKVENEINKIQEQSDTVNNEVKNDGRPDRPSLPKAKRRNRPGRRARQARKNAAKLDNIERKVDKLASTKAAPSPPKQPSGKKPQVPMVTKTKKVTINGTMTSKKPK